ncbi:NADH-quinone oxidoreductase subunit C [Cytophagaceae bacterium 50C-KIRBA]|uniref:NADH-quinone oxidoreductase subunit C n=1 Tax=Aquirufa beregesia TaxID=2516556 RepID=A0ABX0EUD3_9BACT|nr:NADH-quinone oxidoreductase subunit C [Aquirufa beregesia]NGZ44156.1 NADH-quinone oxidoreductase subunit C [Aquirufa beregesia]
MNAVLQIKELIEQSLGKSLNFDEANSRVTLEVDDLVSVCDLLWRSPEAYFDSLSCLTAIDNGPSTGDLELIYTLYSIPNHVTFHIRVVVPRTLPDGALPEVPTVSHIWKTADWHEREAFDLVGVKFTGHPDLRRILLPEDWKGHPLRKDYEEPDTYHGIQVKY